ncbi:chitobiase/beta-hexosaminidase C-terminal domain-containing protein [Polaribacter haliotis]|uniref:Chitobiase/beta-hexosaminidase C-terminal domain-containing protein n=1 Tax=Polaribacter haliotis TaxID=1888915 RepID=A0A7L8AEX8_9FLAO|nr:c-type cytochrome domain-containing protein [Polaribacter haliotis]QOD60484.1 chitobiase/beta-hexosaminidase C-terminal domain-containing protein [Polaribacter haliotis]
MVFTLILTVVIVSISESSRLVLFLGRFHPLILHLPIGALILTLFIDIVGRINNNYPKQTVQYALGFSAFFAVLACYLGYFLSFEGGYDKDTLDTHLWLGVVSAILIIGLFLFSKVEHKKASRLFFPAFIITFIVISFAGHYGSVLTHGSDFLTQYAKVPQKAKVIKNIDSLDIYKDVVHKILDGKCIQCHNPTKRKGELALNSSENILKGGENGAVIEKGNASNSLIYTSLFLPISDKKHMPPEGKPQLTKEEVRLVEYWINNQAHFNEKVANLPKNDTLNKMLAKYLVFEEIKIEEASISAINEAKEAGFSVLKLVPNQPELSVKFQKGEITDDGLKTLNNLNEQIIELDLSNTALTDNMISDLKEFKNLQKLSLNNTKITDKSLANFHNSKRLKVLNLYNTGITNKGLDAFLKHVVPEDIYIWETEVEKDFIAKLESEYKTNLHAGVADGFVEITKLESPTFLTDENLFVDSLTVKLVSKIKNVKTYYTIDGSEPDSTSLKYKDIIFLKNSAHLKLRGFKNGWLPSNIVEKGFFKIKYEVENYNLVNQPDARYPGGSKLFDLKQGGDSFKDGSWAGFTGDNIDVTIDMETIKEIDKISVNCLENTVNWIFFPKKVTVYSSTNKNTGFKKIRELKINRKGKHGEGTIIKSYTVDIPKTKTQFIRVVVENYKALPKWHEGAGKDAWLFVDEILIH